MKYLILVILLVALSGCAFWSSIESKPRLAFQFATLKIINSERATPQEILDFVERARAHVNNADKVTIAKLKELDAWQILGPTERQIIKAIVTNAAERVKDDTRVVIAGKVLDWVEAVARRIANDG